MTKIGYGSPRKCGFQYGAGQFLKAQVIPSSGDREKYSQVGCTPDTSCAASQQPGLVDTMPFLTCACSGILDIFSVNLAS